jgi:hypothetical protein
MMTRRTVLGAGLAVAAVACTTGFGAEGPVVLRRQGVRSIDALFMDESIEMPRQMVAFIEAVRGMSPLVGIQLDAAGQAGMTRSLDMSRTIVGISSGATLFCVERIAWDHGFRLTERSQQRAEATNDDAFRQDVAAFLSGVSNPSARSLPLVAAYRPSREDGLLHAWVMQKSSPQFRQHRREV